MALYFWTEGVFLIFLHFYVYFFFWLPNLRSDTVSGNREEFEKSKFTKNRSEYYHCLYFYRKPRFLHRPSSSKKQTTSANNTSIPPAIYPENHICKVLSEDPEKTNIGTVKMMEAKCEVIVIILIDKSRYYLQGCWCCFSISY